MNAVAYLQISYIVNGLTNGNSTQSEKPQFTKESVPSFSLKSIALYVALCVPSKVTKTLKESPNGTPNGSKGSSPLFLATAV